VPDLAVAKYLQLLSEGLDDLGISLCAAQSDKLVALLLLLKKWNRVYNLTAVRELEAMVGRHLLDSLSLLPWLPAGSIVAPAQPAGVQAQVDVLDAGSGAGLPVLPLAIARPDLHFLSVESNGKKTRFQHQALLELSIDNVQIAHQRVESVAYRAQCVTSRAFAAPADFLSLAEPLCLPEGQVIVMLAQLQHMPAGLPEPWVRTEVHSIQVPGVELLRHVAIYHKR
jgi:16S rRNA (guanine527-N7)-methyltransferase